PSAKAGSRAPPSRSTTSRASSASESASRSSATTRPPWTASARARVPVESPVRTVPPWSTRSTPVMSRSGLDVGHDVLDPRVLLEAVHRQVLAVARVLEAAVRHLRHDRDVGVDPDAAEVEALGHPHRAAVVARPDRGREPVAHAVGPAHGLVLVGEALDGDDRPEDLVLHHLVVLVQAGDDGGLVEVSLVADP